jgi:UPF0176 protein
VDDNVLNISAYRFVTLSDLPALKQRLLDAASAEELKGTVLLAEEGINLFVAGAPDAARRWLAALRSDARFAMIEAKESLSDAVPFRHLRVRIKREIIRMNQPQLRPAAGRASAVDALTLARWLDAGRDDAGRELLMLDTRNAFELEHGAFDGAVDWQLSKFSDFPAAAAARRDTLQGRTVVTYCTGGIRCEKAALALQAAGVEHVLQLDGGILRYLEEVPDARHWHGRCFVFDQRESLDAQLGCVNTPVPAA